MKQLVLMGEKESGKDYLADVLVARYGARKHAFVGPLKRLCHEIYPWLPEDVSREAKDHPWPHPSNVHRLTPRDIWLKVSDGLKVVNVNVFQDIFEESYLTACRENPNQLQIITDFRIEQEWDFIQAHRIPVVKIIDPEAPEAPHPFERWLRAFQGQDFTFVNLKTTGPGPWLEFVEHNRIGF